MVRHEKQIASDFLLPFVFDPCTVGIWFCWTPRPYGLVLIFSCRFVFLTPRTIWQPIRRDMLKSRATSLCPTINIVMSLPPTRIESLIESRRGDVLLSMDDGKGSDMSEFGFRSKWWGGRSSAWEFVQKALSVQFSQFSVPLEKKRSSLRL